MNSLHTYFTDIEDPRRSQGTRYSLASYLSMLTLAYMSGHYPMQSVRRFFVNNKEELIDLFDLKHGVPSYAGIRDFMPKLDFDKINTAFRNWALQFVSIDKLEFISLDGKCLASTVTDCHSSRQDFVSMVGSFVGEKGINLNYHHGTNGKTGEVIQVRQLLKELQNLGCTITLDALHCKKKTIDQIFDQGNHFIIQVKGNAKKLRSHLLNEVKEYKSIVDSVLTTDTKRSRLDHRKYDVYPIDPDKLPDEWNHVKSVILVNRYGQRQGKKYEHKAMYISDLRNTALYFSKGIRQHWSIENNLHRQKDVYQNEDKNQIKNHRIAVITSLIQTMAMNLFQTHGYKSIKKANEKYANKPRSSFELINSNLYIEKFRTV